MWNDTKFPLFPSIKFTPLLSFDTILDLDTGLVNLIKDQYLDTDIFNKELLSLHENDLYSYIYFRPCINPLFTIRNSNMELNEENIKLLDDYYMEFMETKYEDILKYSRRTSMVNLVETFNTSKDIKVSIMVQNELEEKQIKTNDILSKIPIVYIDNIIDDNSYNQIYLKYIYDIELFDELPSNITFYFSDCGVNLDEGFKIKKQNVDYIKKAVSNKNQFSIYNMYREDLINRDFITKKINYNNNLEENNEQ